MDAVWQYAFYTDTSTVTVHIRRLRAKIEADPALPSTFRPCGASATASSRERCARRCWGRGRAAGPSSGDSHDGARDARSPSPLGARRRARRRGGARRRLGRFGGSSPSARRSPSQLAAASARALADVRLAPRRVLGGGALRLRGSSAGRRSSSRRGALPTSPACADAAGRGRGPPQSRRVGGGDELAELAGAVDATIASLDGAERAQRA